MLNILYIMYYVYYVYYIIYYVLYIMLYIFLIMQSNLYLISVLICKKIADKIPRTAASKIKYLKSTKRYRS